MWPSAKGRRSATAISMLFFMICPSRPRTMGRVYAISPRRCAAVKLFGRPRRGALERRVVAEHQHDDDADDGAAGEEHQPRRVAAGPVAQEAEDLRAEIAAEIADRVNGGDAGRR